MNNAQIAKHLKTQCGVITRAQLQAQKKSDCWVKARISSGELVAVFPGVYRHVAQADSWLQRAWAASLYAGDGCVLSHRSAAWLWRLDGRMRPPSTVELSCPHSTRVRQRDGYHFYRSRHFVLDDMCRVQGLPVFGRARVIIELAALLAPEEFFLVATDIFRREPRLRVWVRDTINRLGSNGLKGHAVLLDVLEAETLDSALELRVDRLLKKVGLAPPKVQFPILDGPRLLAVVDFAWPGHRVVVQAHGYGCHSASRRWELDQVQTSDLTARGWRVLLVTWRQLDDEPEHFIANLRAVLAPQPQLGTLLAAPSGFGPQLTLFADEIA